MKLHIDHDEKNHDWLKIHTDTDLLKYKHKKEQGIWKDSDLFQDSFCDDDGYYYDDDDDDDDDEPIFKKHLLQIKGVYRVDFNKYSITIYKGRLFSWRRLIKQIKANLELDLNKGDPSEFTGIYSGKKPKVRLPKRHNQEKAPKKNSINHN